MKLPTLAVHAGHDVDPTTGAVATPIHLSTTFARDAGGVPLGGHTYTRESNPTQTQLEKALAPLEGGAEALVFGSGMAAAVSIFQSLPAGTHVVIPDDVYYGIRATAHDFFSRWGLTYELADMSDPGFTTVLKPGGLLWLETPSNPLLKIVDLASAIAAARAASCATVVDNTFATPILQRPLDLGADVVLHSTTKYLGGHSDVQGGALVFARKDALYEAVFHTRHLLGPVASPFSSWMILRGIRTLACRVTAQCASALAVAQALEAHPAVAHVHYPGLASNRGHEVARRQMSAFGAMLSFQTNGGRDAALRAVSRVNLFTRATSLGGIESLIEHRATSEGPTSTCPQDLVRLSIGLEHPDDLIEDLVGALAG